MDKPLCTIKCDSRAGKKMSSSIPNVPRVKKQYPLNVGLLDGIGAIGMINAASLVSSLTMKGEDNAK